MFGFRKNTWAPRLGALEMQVMGCAWDGRATTVREFVDAMNDADMAITTMQTTLDRLYKKGLLNRRKHGRAFAYEAAVSRSDLITLAMRDLSDDVATGHVEPLVAGFLGLLEQLDPKQSEDALKAIEAQLRR